MRRGPPKTTPTNTHFPSTTLVRAYDDGTNDWDQSGNDSTEITTGLRYVNVPIAVAVTCDQLRVGDNYSATAPATNSVNVSEWKLGGSYDFEVVKAYLGFGQLRNGNLTGFSGYNAQQIGREHV